MDRRLLTGALAAAAAVALGVGGGTYSAFSDSADVPGSTVAAGVLLLDLGPSGSADTAVSFQDLVPGAASARAMWVAANDAASGPAATLRLTLQHLVDVPAPCDTSRGKALGEIASGIGGCAVSGESVSGMPVQGNLSRVLQVDLTAGPATAGSSSCAGGADTAAVALPWTGRGNLRTAARANAGAGTTVELTDGATPLILRPGQGVCVTVRVSWPAAAAASDREHPTDDAAQGDALSLGVRFDLTQVHR